ncbi:MAG: hypothetical protein ACR2JC_09355 [Chloroflexota bacterium]
MSFRLTDVGILLRFTHMSAAWRTRWAAGHVVLVRENRQVKSASRS